MAKPGREIVAIFDSEHALQDTVDGLELAGFNRTDVSTLPSWGTIQSFTHGRVNTVYEAISFPSLPRDLVLDRATIGVLIGVLIAAPLYICAIAMILFSVTGAIMIAAPFAATMGLAGGSVFGLIAVNRYVRSRQRRIAEHVDHGGLVLCIQIDEPGREACALQIIRAYPASNVRVRKLVA